MKKLCGTAVFKNFTISIIAFFSVLIFIELLIHFHDFEKVDYFQIKGIKGDSPIPMFPSQLYYIKNNKRYPLGDIKQIKHIRNHDSIIWYEPLDLKVQNVLGIQNDLKTPGNEKFRICILGDSVTAFPWERFKESIISECDLDVGVLNFAVGGYDLAQIYYVFKAEVLPLSPRIVIYNYFQNDTNQHKIIEKDGKLHICYSNSRIPYAFSIPYINDFLLNHSKFYNFINRRVAGYLQGHVEDYKPRYFYPGYYCAYQYLSGIISLCQKKGIVLVIVNFPVIDKNFPTDDFIRRIAEKFNLKYFDIRDRFIALGYNKDEKFLELRSRPGDWAHYNSDGISLIQDLIFDYLIENKIFAAKEKS